MQAETSIGIIFTTTGEFLGSELKYKLGKIALQNKVFFIIYKQILFKNINILIEVSANIWGNFFLMGKKKKFIDEYLFIIFSRDLEKSKIFIGKILDK